MSNYEKYNKLIVALLGTLSTAGAIMTNGEVQADPELIVGVGGLITSFLVWLVPNKEK